MADMGIARGDFYLGNVWRKTEKKTEAAPKGLPRFHGGEGGIRFSAEKPRRLQGATGALPRAGFRIPPQKNRGSPKGLPRFLWRRRRDSNPRGAFDPYTISNRARSTKLRDFSVCLLKIWTRCRSVRQQQKILYHIFCRRQGLLKKICRLTQGSAAIPARNGRSGQNPPFPRKKSCGTVQFSA